MGFIVGAYRRVPARLGLGPREMSKVLGRERGRHDRAAVVATSVVAAGRARRGVLGPPVQEAEKRAPVWISVRNRVDGVEMNSRWRPRLQGRRHAIEPTQRVFVMARRKYAETVADHKRCTSSRKAL